MKYFEIREPYYALIKAKNSEDAIEVYVKNVSDNDESYPIKDYIEEVESDYALVMLSRASAEDNEQIPIKDLLDDFRTYESSVLLVDGNLI